MEARKPLRVLFCGEHFPFAFSYVKEELASRKLDEKSIHCFKCDTSEVTNAISKADVALPFMASITKEDIIRSEDLKAIIQFGAGLELVDIKAATERGVYVQNIPSEETGNAEATAEHAMYLLLSAARRPEEAKDYFQRGLLGGPVVTQILKKNVVIYGFGGVGKQLVTRLTAFSPKSITVVKRNPMAENEKKKYLSQGAMFSTAIGFLQQRADLDPSPELRTALNTADIVLLTCVLNQETTGLVNQRFLSILKPGVILINVARGQLVEYTAIKAGLEKQNGLDVGFFASDVGCAVQQGAPAEPFPPGDPLAAHPLSFFTPHNGGVADISYRNMAKVLVNHLVAVLNEGKPIGSVNLDSIQQDT